jgi:hypothetical protein
VAKDQPGLEGAPDEPANILTVREEIKVTIVQRAHQPLALFDGRLQFIGGHILVDNLGEPDGLFPPGPVSWLAQRQPPAILVNHGVTRKREISENLYGFLR